MLYFSLLQISPSPTQDWLFISTESGGYAFIPVADNRIPGPTFVNLVYYLKDDIKVNFVRYRCSVMFNRFAAPRQDGEGREGWIFQCQVPRQRWQIRDWLVLSARWVVASLLFQWKTTCIALIFCFVFPSILSTFVTFNCITCCEAQGKGRAKGRPGRSLKGHL